MSDAFGVISSSVWWSRRFRPLAPNDKLVYMYLHTSPHRNQLGLYRLTAVTAADDLNIGADEVRASLEVLAAAQLCDYDKTEALVRVRNWELRNHPQGPQEAIGRMVKGFDKANHHILRTAALLCFALDILHRALGTAKGGDGWNKTEVRSKMEDMIFHRLASYFKADPVEFGQAFLVAGVDASDRVFDTLWHKVSHTGAIPYGAGMAYTTTTTDTNTDQRTENREHHHGTENRDQRTEITVGEGIGELGARGGQPALPADSGRAAPRKVSADTAAQIEAIKARAAKARRT